MEFLVRFPKTSVCHVEVELFQILSDLENCFFLIIINFIANLLQIFLKTFIIQSLNAQAIRRVALLILIFQHHVIEMFDVLVRYENI